MSTQIMNPTQAVICLHDIGRYVEQHFGKGQLSSDIRNVADRLSELSKPAKPVSAKHSEDIYKNTISGQTHEG